MYSIPQELPKTFGTQVLPLLNSYFAGKAWVILCCRNKKKLKFSRLQTPKEDNRTFYVKKNYIGLFIDQSQHAISFFLGVLLLLLDRILCK